MLFPKRRFSVMTYDSLAALAEDLKKHSWTLCAGFELAVPDEPKMLLLNDSGSEDSVQEYAVFRLADDHRDEAGNGHVRADQVESLTVTWLSYEELTEEVLIVMEGGGVEMKTHDLHLEARQGHECDLCR